MKCDEVDYVVVGSSLTGVAAALTLAESGDRVVLMDFDRDTDTIADLPRIHATPLMPVATGVEFEDAMRVALNRAGVEWQTFCHVVRIDSDPKPVVELADGRCSCKGVVFAPNGTEPGIAVAGSSGLHGFGLSYSASADAPFHVSHRVAVFGDGPRAIEHAWVASQFASEVVVLLKERAEEGDQQLLSDLRSSPVVSFERSVTLQSLRAARDGSLSAVEIEGSTGHRWIEASALFVAQRLVPHMDVVTRCARAEAVILAGLAAGVDYWNHAELVDDGIRAARTLLTVHS